MQRKPYFGCPIKATTDTLAGKWKVLIVWQLSLGTQRFAALRGLLPGVSEKVLTEQLRQLEADGIVQRTALGGVPPRVEYALSAAGEELMPILRAMCDWAASNLGVLPNMPRGGGSRVERLGSTPSHDTGPSSMGARRMEPESFRAAAERATPEVRTTAR